MTAQHGLHVAYVWVRVRQCLRFCAGNEESEENELIEAMLVRGMVLDVAVGSDL